MSLVVQRASGALREFNEAGILAASDIHVALRLSSLADSSDPTVDLAAAFTVRAVRAGSVCLDLNRLREIGIEDFEGDIDELPWPTVDEIVAAVSDSVLVNGSDRGELRPLRLVQTDDGWLLYLERYYLQEQSIRHILDARGSSFPAVGVSAADLDALFAGAVAPDRQRIAAALAASMWTTVIAGGPGTGKTHTVARVLALLLQSEGAGLRIGLAAPTGKAAARLEEAVAEQAAELGLPKLSAMTLHRLLGWKPGSKNRFAHDAHNRLPYDVIVVDETSMVSLTLMCRLLEAVRADTRLILVGDPDQLTSVDAGAVLADLVARPLVGSVNPVVEELVSADLSASGAEALTDGERSRLGAGVIRLTRGRRFGGDIAAVAEAIRVGDADEVLRIIAESDQVTLCAPDDLAGLRDDVVESSGEVTAAALEGNVAAALAGLERHRLLCAHREGPYGVEQWAQRAMEWVGESIGVRLDPAHPYAGQPLMVTQNDHEARIYNGDTGVIVAQGESLMAAFGRGGDPILMHPTAISDVQTVYAMTIHRSQGSQYDAVTVVLPEEGSVLLTRELLYTAVTRARERVRIVGSAAEVAEAVTHRVMRASGLALTNGC
ncbi:exodeoxyribonuclease V subunit alpha [Jongsikchunia kroppenstedtii]|uniref:exodeoxyribonuclease V subunit alpha n=1 Tax=Jongsikchunia kroppenstedtii TaxID=1121721 RepID=UPI00036F5428|nr:exodeoxyribonuclease V subunit alpha [Jongsikchunia kroppenstedtii]